MSSDGLVIQKMVYNLTNLGQEKMAVIFQTTFVCMKIVLFFLSKSCEVYSQVPN